jgi:hypothetical protein
VLEIQAPGRKLPPFNDFLEFSVKHSELKYLFAHEEAHRDWKAAQSAVGGFTYYWSRKRGTNVLGARTARWEFGAGGIITPSPATEAMLNFGN